MKTKQRKPKWIQGVLTNVHTFLADVIRIFFKWRGVCINKEGGGL